MLDDLFIDPKYSTKRRKSDSVESEFLYVSYVSLICKITLAEDNY